MIRAATIDIPASTSEEARLRYGSPLGVASAVDTLQANIVSLRDVVNNEIVAALTELDTFARLSIADADRMVYYDGNALKTDSYVRVGTDGHLGFGSDSSPSYAWYTLHDVYAGNFFSPNLDLVSDNGSDWSWVYGRGSGGNWKIGATDELGDPASLSIIGYGAADILFGIVSSIVIRVASNLVTLYQPLTTQAVTHNGVTNHTAGFLVPKTNDYAYNPFGFGAQGAFLFDSGDNLRFQSPITAEFYDFETGPGWSSYSSPNWKTLTDGKGDTNVALDYDHRKVRLTYQISGANYTSLFRIAQKYLDQALKITVEDSPDGVTWTTRIAERTARADSQVALTSDSGYALYEAYIRITIWAYNMGVSDTWNLSGIQGITYRSGDQGGTGFNRYLPMDWNENKSVFFPTSVGSDSTRNGYFLNTGGKAFLFDPYSGTEIEFLTSSAGSGYGHRVYGQNSDGSLRIAARSNAASWTDRVIIDSLGYATWKNDFLIQGSTGYDAASETATLYLGDTNARVRATYSVGLSLSAAGAPDALKIAENTGDVQVEYGDIILATDAKGIIMTNAAGTVTKRVRLNDAGDGLVFETP